MQFELPPSVPDARTFERSEVTFEGMARSGDCVRCSRQEVPGIRERVELSCFEVTPAFSAPLDANSMTYSRFLVGLGTGLGVNLGARQLRD